MCRNNIAMNQGLIDSKYKLAERIIACSKYVQCKVGECMMVLRIVSK